jgi:hypothetical protein
LLGVAPAAAAQLALTPGSVGPSSLHAAPSTSSAPSAPRSGKRGLRIGDRSGEVKGVTRNVIESSGQSCRWDDGESPSGVPSARMAGPPGSATP